MAFDILSEARAISSAYISIYNDWDILSEAIASIAPYVSEIVVVDGAYAWMIPNLQGLNLRDDRSSEPVYRVLEQAGSEYGISIKRLVGVWESEIDKRQAGYDACQGRFVFRIDADEILVVNNNALMDFFLSGDAIAEMEMPLCAAPGYMFAQAPGKRVERQSLVFDRLQVSAADHLHYLWLVTGPDRLPDSGRPARQIFGRPIAFNSHLTGWRTPDTALIRAAFYKLNFARENSLAWLTRSDGTMLAGQELRGVLMGCDLVVGYFEQEGRLVRPSPPYGRPREGILERLFTNFLDGLVKLNEDFRSSGRPFANGEPIYFDLSTDHARRALMGSSGSLRLRLSAPPKSVKAQLCWLSTSSPHWQRRDILCRISGADLEMEVGACISAPECLRQVLRLEVWIEGSLVHSMKLVDRPHDGYSRAMSSDR